MSEPAPASCPKCGAARTAATACPRCGIAVDRMAAYAEARDRRIHPDVAAAWERARAAWDSPAAHDEVFRLATQHGGQAWAAARYREEHQARGATGANPFLERTRRTAEATLLASASAARRPRERKPFSGVVALLVILVVLVLLGVGAGMFLRGEGGARRPQPSPALAPSAGDLR